VILIWIYTITIIYLLYFKNFYTFSIGVTYRILLFSK